MSDTCAPYGPYADHPYLKTCILMTGLELEECCLDDQLAASLTLPSQPNAFRSDCFSSLCVPSLDKITPKKA